MILFNREFEFEYGIVETVAPGIRRIVAYNPGPYTFHGTGTYIVGEDEVAVIDPGPAIAGHIEALAKVLSEETISHILVTHTHKDHSAGVGLLQQYCDAPAYGYGPHGAGIIERDSTVEAGADWDFEPDIRIEDGEIIRGKSWSVECVHTPGHTTNHICFQLRETKTLFSGDHVMAWSTTIISPPDGDLAQYYASLDLLLQRDDSVYWPTHGACITEPKTFVRDLIAHRKNREQQILHCLTQGRHTVDQLVQKIYHEIPQALYPAAARSVLATLIYLVQENEVACQGAPSIEKTYALA